MNPLISVIVPVYNGEDFIEKCITSILNQTYKNLEIIIINDGSKDRSAAICNHFAELDERIIVIHQPNMGLSAVRNKGLDIASGELIGFVDNDDSIHPRMYEILQKLLYEYHADIAMCEVVKVYNENINEHIRESNHTIREQHIHFPQQEDLFENLFNEKNLITVVPWNKLYRKEVFKHVNYPDGKVHDDEFVIHHIIQSAEKFVLTDAVLYFYFHNEDSFTNEKYNLRRLDAIEALKDRVLFFEEKKYHDLLKRGLNTYLHLIIIHYFLVKKYFPDEKEAMDRLKKEYKTGYQAYRNILDNTRKKELKLFLFHPAIYKSFIGIRKRFSNLNVLRRFESNAKG